MKTPVTRQENNQGFNKALFLNIPEFNQSSLNSKKDIRDSSESIRLSIESLTPGTTPKGTEKQKFESTFKFCLAKDLIKMLEDEIPSKESIFEEAKSKFDTASTSQATPDFEFRESNIHLTSDGVARKINFGCTPPKYNTFNIANLIYARNLQQKFVNNDQFKSTIFQTQNPFQINQIDGWTCDSCKNINFKSKIIINHLDRINCNRCNKPKEEDVNPKQKKRKQFVEREGDWRCAKCKNLNFSFRTLCNRCNLTKNESEEMDSTENNHNN
jgi:hypothetical protein